MQFQTILIFMIATASAAVAKPFDVAARQPCAILVPTSPALPSTFNISESPSPPQSNKVDMTFNIPTGSEGPCVLVASFPAGYSVASAGYAQINVRALDGPAAGSLVGTVTLLTSPSQPTLEYINSFACATTMSYELSIAADWTPGWVEFVQTTTAGIFMKVGDAC